MNISQNSKSPCNPNFTSISVVIPIYNEEEILPELRRRLVAVLNSININSSEIIFVSDGSTDSSETIITDMAAEDDRFCGIFLSRNFGHQAAISTGLSLAKGEIIAVLDGDLQDPPEVLLNMLDELSKGADVAYGIRLSRKEIFYKRLSYWLFYRIVKQLASIDIPLDAGDFACMKRNVVDAMHQLPEKRRFIRGIRNWVGFKHVSILYHRDRRFAGKPKMKFSNLVRFAFDGLFSFSDIPIKLIQIIGFLVSLFTFLIGILYFILSFIVDSPRGFPTLIISIWFLSGVQLFSLGLLGEYLHRTFDQSLGRPISIIRDKVGKGLSF